MKTFQYCVLSAILLFSACARQERKREPSALPLALVAGIGVSYVVLLSSFAGSRLKLITDIKELKRWQSGQWLMFVDKNRNALVFKSLSRRDARNNGINEVQRRAYNDQLSLLNLFVEKMAAEVHTKAGDRSEIDGVDFDDLADEMINELGITKPAYEAFRKVVVGIVRKIEKNKKLNTKLPS